MLTPESKHRDFPTLRGIHYLNTAAESIPPLCVRAAIETYYEDKARGMAGREQHFAQVEACREISARFLGLTPTEVSFCSCSSEAYNLLASALRLSAQDEVIVTDLDFPAGATPWMNHAASPTLHLWKNRDGILHLDDLAPLLNEHTRLVQISLVSFYNGHRIPFPPLHDLVRLLAPNALISVDITQALGRVALDCAGADILISSTHKWTLGIHGGCIIGIPARNATRLTTNAGGWYHLANAFDADRFERLDVKTGAASFSVGMPNFISLYALNAALRYLDAIGIPAITEHADPLMEKLQSGLRDLGVKTLCPWEKQSPSGIIAFQHTNSAAIHAQLLAANIHIMHAAGRLRIAVHGYNTSEDIAALLAVLLRLVK
jgi:cysteine desulfurase / selenocysteine lyase